MEAVLERELTLDDYKGPVDPDWCPGCGDFGVLNALQRAALQLELLSHEMMIVSGIGCSSNLPRTQTKARQPQPGRKTVSARSACSRICASVA